MPAHSLADRPEGLSVGVARCPQYPVQAITHVSRWRQVPNDYCGLSHTIESRLILRDLVMRDNDCSVPRNARPWFWSALEQPRPCNVTRC